LAFLANKPEFHIEKSKMCTNLCQRGRKICRICKKNDRNSYCSHFHARYL